MKNITIVFHDDNIHSGATSSMLDLIPGLAEQYYIRAIIPKRNGDLASYLESKKIEYIRCPYYSSRVRSNISKFEYSRFFLKNFIKILYSSIFYMLNIRFFVKSDIIYSNTSDSYFGFIASILFRKSHVSHIREFGIADQDVTHFIGDKLFYNLILKYSTKTIVISKSLRKHVSSHIKNVEIKNKLFLVYDDVHFDSIKLAYPHQHIDLKMLIVGTISLGKGQEFVIDSVYELSKRGIKVGLGIAGDDTTQYAMYLKNKVSQLGLDEQVIFHGFCKDMLKLRNQYPIAVIASKSEAFGRVTIEAMGNNQLVIASDTGANPELIQDKDNGFIFESKNVNSFCEVVENIVALDPSQIQGIIASGEKSAQIFNGEKAARNISKILSDI
ncbi:hypothetical protein OA5_05975 [Vibrio cyclitrophicus 1F111]|uniref:glycosyltransferase family 4 protein n=1 Tax=Vibrio cyclitrophicus TaxID=47951 RepID=UPI00031F9B66|nr:glycosyltransferase family 4 protein [Vibrio cyclitrophicus]OEF75422.1 hypothetical protein OA5_05975 [Vibrio cyclitrophicus 1F111]